MGDVNIGGLFASLNLDNSQFLETLEKTSGATQLWRMDLTGINGDLGRLVSQLRQAGVDLDKFSYSGKSLSQVFSDWTRKGLTASESVNKITEDLNRLLNKMHEVSQYQASINVAGKLPEHGPSKDEFQYVTQATSAVRQGLPISLVTEEYRNSVSQLAGLSKPYASNTVGSKNNVGADELSNYRALIEAERLRRKALEETYAKQQDYANLVKRLAAEEEAGKKQDLERIAIKRRGYEEAAKENERILGPQRAEESKHEKDMANLRAQYTKEANDAKTKYDKEYQVNRVKIEEDARKRLKEINDQIVGDAQAIIRKQEEDQKAAREREYAAYIQHRRAMQQASALTTVGTTVAGAGAAIVGGGLFFSKEAAEFQDSMAKALSEIGPVSAAIRDRIANMARESAKETGIAAKSIAENFAVMAKGGWTTAQAIQAQGLVTKFAVASNSELHESTRQVITIMEALQLPFSQMPALLDKLTFANQIARGSVDQLATALEGRAGAALRAAKVDVNEALAIVIAFSKAGVTASQSQTYLTQIIEKLREVGTKYGTVLVDIAGKQMKMRDIVYQSDGSMRPFLDTLRLLDTAFKGRSAEAINNFFNDIHLGSARGGQALKILLGTIPALEELQKRVAESAGVMQEAFGIRMQSPLEQLKVLKANLVDVAITLGIPVTQGLMGLGNAMKPLLTGVQDLAKAFASLPTNMQQVMALSVLGAGGFLAMGGGVLVLLGHLIRLKADLTYLQGANALGGLPATLQALATKGAVSTLVLTAVAGGIAAITKEYLRLKKEVDEKTKRSDGLEGSIGKNDSFYGFGYRSNYDPNAGVEKIDIQKIADARAKLQGITNKALGELSKPTTVDEGMESLAERTRKAIEEFKKAIDEGFKEGNFSIDPEKVLKKALKVEDLRQSFEKFSQDFNSVLDKLTGDEQDAISSMAMKAGEMLASGVDIRLVKAKLDEAELQLRGAKANAAERARQDGIRQAQESASSAIEAFRERYTADLSTLTGEQKALMDGLIASLQAGLGKGLATKVITSDLKEVELTYKYITDAIKDTTRVQNELTRAAEKYVSEQKKISKERVEVTTYTKNPFVSESQDRTNQIASLLKEGGFKNLQEYNRSAGEMLEGNLTSALDGVIQRIQDLNPGVLELAEAFRKLTVEAKEASKESALKALGVRSQESLDLAANAAKVYVDRLKEINTTGYDMKAAYVAYWEAVARAAHKAPEEISRYYSQFKRETADTVAAAQTYWRRLTSEIGREISGMFSSFSKGLLDIVFPKQTDTKDKLAPLVTALRDVYEQLGTYSDPKRALEGVIKMIQGAGTAAQANAIAVKYFGNTVGPQLARDLRNGSISADDIAKAIDRATKSTLEYEQQTADSLSKISQLWRQLVADILKLIIENLIKLGFKELLQWLFNIEGKNLTLSQVVVEAWKKIKDAIFGVKKAAEETGDALGKIPGVTGPLPTNGGYGSTIPAGTTPPTFPGGSKQVPSGGGNTGSGSGNSLGQFGDIANLVTGAVSAIANVVQAFQLHGIGNDTGKIEVNTRGILEEMLNLRRDDWDRETHLMAKLDDIWKEVREGNIFGWIKMLHDKVEQFVIPDLASINATLIGMANGNVALATPAAAGAGGTTVQVMGDVVVQKANTPEQLVRELKSRRIVRGVK